jgi:hypothetical protein
LLTDQGSFAAQVSKLLAGGKALKKEFCKHKGRVRDTPVANQEPVYRKL